MNSRSIDPLGHPARPGSVGMLTNKELTPAEVRRSLPGEPSPATVAYHLAILERALLVERVGWVYRKL